MAKGTKIYECANCGYQSPKWQGRCSDCGQWNTFEESQTAATALSKSASNTAPGKLINLAELKKDSSPRVKVGISEFDTVLGGGLVQGSLVMLGGDPGIGKSTLALQTALLLVKNGSKVVYVSGEESAFQIKDRESRLGVKQDLQFLSETNLETVIATLDKNDVQIAVIDSIQTLYSTEVNGVIGGVSQIVYAANMLMRFAKAKGVTLILIGHVTKEGVLAGPKTLEHMVDTVLYLEGERFGSFRLLRGVKNRFGAIGEVGVFEMTSEGLREVTNPSEMFLQGRSLGKTGSAVTAVMEGNKILLVEVQALVNKALQGYPARKTSGFDANRLQLILAILQKHLDLPLQNFDVYVNVAGGIKLEERAGDLAVALAVLSSMYNQVLPKDMVAFGEIGLTGEIRTVTATDKRKKEATKLGFKTLITADKYASVKNLLSLIK